MKYHAVPPAPSVLLGFRASNVRSFRDPVELSLMATATAEKEHVRSVPWREGGRPLNVHTALGIFGANGSGKSNVLKALDDMRHLVINSFRNARPTGGVMRRPFILDAACRHDATHFELDLVLQGVRWEYGFAVNDEEVLEEWAYTSPRGKSALVFHRERMHVRVGANWKSKSRAAIGLLRPNALFLSTAASANVPSLLDLYGWFERNLLLAEADSRPARQVLTTKLLEDPHMATGVRSLLTAADLGISGATKTQPDPILHERMQRAVHILMGEHGDPADVELPGFDEMGVMFTHRTRRGEDIMMLAQDESLGTRVWFALIGPVIMSLSEGTVFLADELDSSLHPALVKQLVRIFESPVSNPHRAQLIFNSHDSNLLGDGSGDRLLGRDQIWLSEKDHDGNTRIFPLTSMAPRKSEALGKRYLAGRYGGVPILSEGQFAHAAALIAAGEHE